MSVDRQISGACRTIYPSAIRAGWRARRLGVRYHRTTHEQRIEALVAIEAELKYAHTLARSALIVARHDAARQA